MNKVLVFIVTFAFCMATYGQEVYTKECNDKALTKKAAKWEKKGEWRNGFKAAGPDGSVNLVEFYTQYKKNPEQWNAMFRWLATNDLYNISKGKHPIEGTNLVVSVEDSRNEALEKRRSESHYHHIDFQYVVKGTERFGIIEHLTSKPNCEYKPDVIHYDYEVGKARFYDSTPDKFFLFFPSDWHIAKVKTELEDQDIRVTVVKLDYIE